MPVTSTAKTATARFEDVSVSTNQPRLLVEHRDELRDIIGDDLYFVATFPKADVVIVSTRDR